MNIERLKDKLKSEKQISIITIVDLLIAEAWEDNASDIHIDPTERDIRVQFRIDGKLYEKYRLDSSYHIGIICRIKILAKLRTDEHQLPQDGRFRIPYSEEIFIDIRISIIPTYYGENIVLRLLRNTFSALKFEDLGFSKPHENILNKILQKTHGMILITGPTGSGKTTTLYTLLRSLNTGQKSIITIEDPIEYSISGVRHVQVNTHRGLTFAHGLRALLRQDPDIIMVGEIRDAETAMIATHIALTGHLLLSTLHTTDAATALPRLLDMKIDGYLIAATVDVVISQRLVRTLCPYCKKVLPVSEEDKNVLTLLVPEGTPTALYYPEGCKECNNSGYKGRIGIYEVLIVTDKIREAMLRQASDRFIRAQAQKSGMTSMLEDGISKVLQGITTLHEVLAELHE